MRSGTGRGGTVSGSARAGAAVLLAAVCAAGCGVVTPHADSDSGSTPAAPAPELDVNGVDIAALDIGPYPRVPAAPFGPARPEELPELDAQRLAEYAVLPWELDPVLTRSPEANKVLVDMAHLGFGHPKPVVEALTRDKAQYGYQTSRGGPLHDGSVGPDHRQLGEAILHFPSEKESAAAMQDVGKGFEAQPGGSDKPYTLARDLEQRLQDTVLYTRPVEVPEKFVEFQALTFHGPWMLMTEARAPQDKKDWALDTLAKTVEQQRSLVDTFPADQQPSTRDRDSLLVYTIPELDPEAQGSEDAAVYGLKGMAQQLEDPVKGLTLLTETGSDRNAVGRSTVHRAKDDDSAKKLLDGLVEIDKGATYTPSSPPPGLPVATCLDRASSGEVTGRKCYVRRGRLVGEVAEEDPSDVDRAVSSQYLLLGAAEPGK